MFKVKKNMIRKTMNKIFPAFAAIESELQNSLKLAKIKVAKKI